MASAFRKGSLAVEDVMTYSLDRQYEESSETTPLESLTPLSERTRGVSLEVDGVAKQFGNKSVLSDIHLSVEQGEFIAIVGRSGCGKSTLLRLLAGLDEISSGSLKRQGQKVAGMNPDTRFMFQDARLLPWSTVLDNVKIGLSGASSLDAERKAYSALRLVGLEDRGKEWPSVLSGGQRQRVALARALVGNPRLLLFDEPLGALDALTRIDMQRLIEGLWEQRGFTAVLVTHDVSEAVALADRVILIEEGRIAQDISITLSRPRMKDSGSAHFEKIILDRVLTSEGRQEEKRDIPLYDI
ncbi:ATP-binding cassette domain-containing protein [Paenibacillus sp. FA6]|uniref:ATP-binding cassette domain-containing protein n=1 Tax=Paenibacillus sp. FA6 TaxID=3413029 RepID=UPI003F659EDF